MDGVIIFEGKPEKRFYWDEWKMTKEWIGVEKKKSNNEGNYAYPKGPNDLLSTGIYEYISFTGV